MRLALMIVLVASLISSPLSTWLIGLDRVFGLKGWQFFCCSGAFCALAFVCSRACMMSRPKQIFFTPEEQNYFQSTINQEAVHKPSYKLWVALTNKNVIALGMVNLG